MSDNRVSHVDEPLAWDLVHVTVLWKEFADLRCLPDLLEYAADAERLILWAVEHLDVIALDTASVLDMRDSTYYLRLPDTMSLRK